MEGTYANSVLFSCPADSAEHALAGLRDYVREGTFVQHASAGIVSTVALLDSKDGRAVQLDFETEGKPMLDDDLCVLAEKLVFHWGGGHDARVHSIFTYPEGHPGYENGRTNEQGRAYGDIIVSSSFRDGPGVSTFANTMPEWGVEVDRW